MPQKQAFGPRLFGSLLGRYYFKRITALALRFSIADVM